MPRRPSPFRPSDVRQIVKAVLAGGMDVARVEFDPATGKIVVFSNRGLGEPTPATSLDEWKAGRGAGPSKGH
jgi:hypothetical protein